MNPVVPFALVLAGMVAPAFGSCPATNGRDFAACDARPSTATVGACARHAALAETCAQRATGVVYRMYLVRAMSEFTKAGLGAGARTARGRRWLAHATVLAERVQDDPGASPELRRFAKDGEAKAKRALFGR